MNTNRSVQDIIKEYNIRDVKNMEILKARDLFDKVSLDLLVRAVLGFAILLTAFAGGKSILDELLELSNELDIGADKSASLGESSFASV